MQKKMWIIAGCLLISFIVIIFCIWYFNTNIIFKRKFNFALPKEVKIISTSYSLYYDSLDMKASFRAQDFETIKKGLSNYGQNNASEVNLKSKDEMFPIRSSFRFWEEEKEEAIFAYCGYKQGRWGIKTRLVCILVTNDVKDKNQYFIYVYY